MPRPGKCLAVAATPPRCRPVARTPSRASAFSTRVAAERAAAEEARRARSACRAPARGRRRSPSRRRYAAVATPSAAASRRAPVAPRSRRPRGRAARPAAASPRRPPGRPRSGAAGCRRRRRPPAAGATSRVELARAADVAARRGSRRRPGRRGSARAARRSARGPSMPVMIDCPTSRAGEVAVPCALRAAAAAGERRGGERSRRGASRRRHGRRRRRAPGRSRRCRRGSTMSAGRPDVEPADLRQPEHARRHGRRGVDRLGERHAERVQVPHRLDHRQHAAGEHAVGAAHGALVHLRRRGCRRSTRRRSRPAAVIESVTSATRPRRRAPDDLHGLGGEVDAVEDQLDDHVVAGERRADDARVAVQERPHRVEEVRDRARRRGRRRRSPARRSRRCGRARR